MILLKISTLVVLLCISPTLEDSLQDYLRSQTSDWCNLNPRGLVFNKGKYFNCSIGNRYGGVRFRNETLEGVTFKIGILEGSHDHDFDCGVEEKDGLWMAKDNYSNYILGLLKDVLHFEIKYVITSQSKRSKEARNNWTALANMIENNVTDISGCHWAVTDITCCSIDYLLSTLRSCESFVFVPDNLPLKKDVFLRTFSPQLWVLFFLSIFILIVSFKFSIFVHSRIRPDHEPWSWDEVVLWAIAAIAQQSYSRHPRGSSCRTMFLIGYTISYLLYTGFAAGVTSLLALNGHRYRLSFDDVASMRLRLVFHRDEYYSELLNNNFNSHASFTSHILNKEFDNLNGIFRRIQKENFIGYGTTVAFINYLKKIDSAEGQKYSIFSMPNFNRQKSFLIRKSFPFKNLFNYWLLKFRETGLLHLGKQKFLEVERVALHNTNIWLSADLENVFSAVVFLIVGWILSVLILLGEIFYWKKVNK